MADWTIYHNPRCSKSRATLKILEEEGIEPQVVEYLKEPPDAETIERLLEMLACEPIDIIRTKEAPFAELGLGGDGVTRAELIEAMVAHPILIERPIVVRNGKAVLGRPPENVHELF